MPLASQIDVNTRGRTDNAPWDHVLSLLLTPLAGTPTVGAAGQDGFVPMNYDGSSSNSVSVSGVFDTNADYTVATRFKHPSGLGSTNRIPFSVGATGGNNRILWKTSNNAGAYRWEHFGGGGNSFSPNSGVGIYDNLEHVMVCVHTQGVGVDFYIDDMTTPVGTLAYTTTSNIGQSTLAWGAGVWPAQTDGTFQPMEGDVFWTAIYDEALDQAGRDALVAQANPFAGDAPVAVAVANVTTPHLVLDPPVTVPSSGVTVANVTHGHIVDDVTVSEIVTPAITAVNAAGTSPYPGETGVQVLVSNDGASQGSMLYNGNPVSITGWVAGTYTVTWPSVVQGDDTALNVNYDLTVTTTGGTSAPFSQQTQPAPNHEYVRIGTRASGLVNDQALWDTDDLGADPTQVLVYGAWSSPAGIENFLDQWYANAIPNGTFTIVGLFDEQVGPGGQWSNSATKTFNVSTPIVQVPVSSMTHGHSVGDPTVAAQIGVADVTHAQSVTAMGFVVQVSVGPVRHFHIVQTITSEVNDPPVLTVPNDVTLFYDDPPGTGIPQSDPLFQAWVTAATAFDDEDGDITANITTNENSLVYPLTAANTPQTLTWTVSDSVGQTVQESRQITARVRVTPTGGIEARGLNLAISLEL